MRAYLVPAETDAEHLFFADVIRAWATFLVVLLHTAAPKLSMFNDLERSRWWAANVIDSFTRPSVPLFVMLSGMLLLRRETEDLEVFFRKRITKVLVPFLGWATFYLVARRIEGGAGTLPVEAALREVLSGPIYYHFWFIYMVMGLYLATPVLRIYVHHASRKNLLYALGLWFFVVAIAPLFDRFLQTHIGIDFVVMTGFAGYFLLGYFLRPVEINKRQARLLIALLAGAVLFTAVFTYLLTLNANGEFDDFLYGYLNLNVIAMAISSFLLLKNLPYRQIKSKVPIFEKLISYLSLTSLGVYFLHAFILDLLDKGALGFTVTGDFIHPLIGLPVVAAGVVIVCAIIILIMRKIPIVKLFVP